MMLLYDPEGEEEHREPHSNIQQLRQSPSQHDYGGMPPVTSHRKEQAERSKEKYQKLPAVEFRDNHYIRGVGVSGTPVPHGTFNFYMQ